MRGTSLQVKIYKSCVQSVMIYGSETWAMKVEGTQTLKRTEAIWCVGYVVWTCISLKNHLLSEAPRGKLSIDCLLDVVRHHRVIWFDHFEWKQLSNEIYGNIWMHIWILGWMLLWRTLWDVVGNEMSRLWVVWSCWYERRPTMGKEMYEF